MAYPKNNSRVALDISNRYDHADYKSLITYQAHGRGNQLLGYEYRPEKNGYIIYAGNNEQKVLRNTDKNTILADILTEPVNNFTKFDDEYIWDIIESQSASEKGFYTIKNRKNNLYITTDNTSNDILASLQSFKNTDSQKFRLQTMNGLYRIRSNTTNSMVWDITGGVYTDRNVIAYPNRNQANQEWMILFKPNDNHYIIANNKRRNILIQQSGIAGANGNSPKTIFNSLSFDQNYPNYSQFYFNTINFNNNSDSIVQIRNKEFPNYVYTKNSVTTAESYLSLNLPSDGGSNQLWILEKIDEIPKPEISNIVVESARPETKYFFYVGEQIKVKGDYFGSGFTTYDLYSKFDTADTVLLQTQNPIGEDGRGKFETIIDTREYKEGDYFIELFARADSMFQSNRVASRYNMKFPTPTGKPVPQFINQNTPIENLNLSDFVTDLTDEMENDIKIVGISDLDTSKVGTQIAKVEIKNDYKSTMIEVPVSIGPVWGDVPWEYSKKTGELIFTSDGNLGEFNLSPWNRLDHFKVPYDEIKKITFTSKVNAPENSDQLFGTPGDSLYNVEEINGLEKMDTSEVERMSSMFRGMKNLKTINLSSFKTNKVTHMDSMFRDLSSVESIDVSMFDTSNVTNMDNMFTGMRKVTALDISQFDTSRKPNTNSLFGEMPNLKWLKLGVNTKIENTSLVSPSGNDYTDKWQSIGKGTSEIPIGEFVGTALELEQFTQKKSIADTYVWEPITSVNMTINYFLLDKQGKETEKYIIKDLEKGERQSAIKETFNHQHISLKSLLEEKEISTNPKFEGYELIVETSKFETSSHKTLTIDSELPKEDFMLNYYFKPVVNLTVPTEINFGVRQKNNLKNIYSMEPSHIESNNKISIIDTFETNQNQPEWKLYASTEGFYNADSGVRLLADVLIKSDDFDELKVISKESTALYDNSNFFKKDISLIDKKQDEGLFIKVAKVQELGQYNGVIKYKLEIAP